MKENYFLAKWLSSEINEDELKNYLSEDEIRSYKKIISASKQLETPKYNTQQALAKIKQQHSKTKVKKLNFINYFYRVAAVLAITFTSYYFISTKTTSYATNLAEKTTFELPDNSIVRLNADSKIEYKAKDWDNNRKLNLKGEAYFSVSKGSKFTVHTTLGNVSVLGTKFNVVARDAYFQVSCYEGLVSVNYQNQIIKVPAGSSFKFLNNTFILNTKVTEAKPSWIQNKSSFKSMPYKYVVEELERQYNVEVTFNSKYSNVLFTGNFIHTNLETALQAVSIPLNLKFTIFKDKKVELY